MLLAVGRIGRPHGIRGDVTVEVRTDDPETRFAAGARLMTDPADRGPLTVTAMRHSGQVTLLTFADIDDRSAAEALRGTVLQVDSDALPELTDTDEYYDHQLVGLRALTTTGTALGTVTDVVHAPASPLLSITGPDGSAELVPFVAAIVPEVDLAAGTVTVDPPDGMFG